LKNEGKRVKTVVEKWHLWYRLGPRVPLRPRPGLWPKERRREGVKGCLRALRLTLADLFDACRFLSWNLSEGAALDLLAVLSALELLVVRLVLAGDESRSQLDGRGLSQTNISSKTSNLAGNSLHAFLASHDCAVDIIDTFDNIGHGVHIIFSMTLPTHARQGNESGEEKGETSQNEDAHNNGGEVGQGLLFLIRHSAVAVGGGSVAGSGGSVRSGGGSVRGCGLFVGLGGGSISGISVVMGVVSVPL